MKKLNFDYEPEFAELWDACLHNLLYDKDSYVGDILDLFKKLKITPSSKILDTCAGSGFISLYLRQNGYDVNCMDLMVDEIRCFRKNARKLDIEDRINQLSWEQIPTLYLPETYDFLFCRGNSFIYADGGWNQEQTVNPETSLRDYERTLKIFYDTLKTGGYLYIDKFPDSEEPNNDIVAKLSIGGSKEDLVFYTKRFPEKGFREARMIRRAQDGKEISVPNKTYDLKENELENMLLRVGFKEVNRIELDSEKNFSVWLARK